MMPMINLMNSTPLTKPEDYKGIVMLDFRSLSQAEVARNVAQLVKDHPTLIGRAESLCLGYRFLVLSEESHVSVYRTDVLERHKTLRIEIRLDER